MKVLVSGGRHYRDRAFLDQKLDAIHAATPIHFLIQGGATGADSMAMSWALSKGGIHVRTYYARWDALGDAAGPVRNIQMLDEGRPDLVVVFPGGRGTRHLLDAARARVLGRHGQLSVIAYGEEQGSLWPA
jgi:hypothetical protein